MEEGGGGGSAVARGDVFVPVQSGAVDVEDRVWRCPAGRTGGDEAAGVGRVEVRVGSRLWRVEADGEDRETIGLHTCEFFATGQCARLLTTPKQQAISAANGTISQRRTPRPTLRRDL